MSINTSTSVAIIGGGVTGCSIAYQLSKAGVQVSILEREEIAAEASSAAAGLLAPAGVLTGLEAGAKLFLASWSITPEVIAEIEAVIRNFAACLYRITSNFTQKNNGRTSWHRTFPATG